MKISTLLSVSLLIIPLTFYSCGSDDDSSTTIVQPEEDTSGTTTGGTTGGGGGSSCMTTSQRNNITNMFNRGASVGTYSGEANGSFRFNDGTVVNSNDEWKGDYNIVATSGSSWNVQGSFCDSGGNCSFTHTYQAAFVDGCLNWAGKRAKIQSTTPGSLKLTTPNGSTTDSLSIQITSGGFMGYRESFTADGRKRSWSFRSDSGGADDGGTDGGTVEGGSSGGTATGGTATGGTATGGTATGGTATGGTATGGTTTGGTATGGASGGTPGII